MAEIRTDVVIKISDEVLTDPKRLADALHANIRDSLREMGQDLRKQADALLAVARG